MADEVNMNVASFQRLPHQVSLVETAVKDDGPCVLCVAFSDEPTETFVIVKIVQLWHQGTSNGGKSVILIEDSGAHLIAHLLAGFRIQTTLIAKSFCHGRSKNAVELGYRDHDVILTSCKTFLESLACGWISLGDLGLVVVNSCHHTLHEDSPMAKLVKKLSSHYQRSETPKVVGITTGLLEHQKCYQDMENFLSKLEAIFHCSASVSSDLLAMNRFGEHIVAKCCSFSHETPNDAVSQLFDQTLSEALHFLGDCKPSDEQQQDCLTFVTFLMGECHKVLQMLGAWACSHVAGLIGKECTKFAKRYAGTESAVFLNFCRTQAGLLHSYSKTLKGRDMHLTSLMVELLGILKRLQTDEVEKTQPASGFSNCTNVSTRGSEVPCGCVQSFTVGDCNPDTESKGSSVVGAESSDKTSGSGQCPGQGNGGRNCCGVEANKLDNRPKGSAQSSANQPPQGKTSTDPLCIVFLRSDILARALSSLINVLAAVFPEYCFLKSQFLSGKKPHSDEAKKTTEAKQDCMNGIQDGSVNLLVTTYDAESEIRMSRCSLVIRIGSLPVDYFSYKQIKEKGIATGAQCFIFVPEEKEEETNSKLQEFQQMELVLGQRCLQFCAPAIQVSGLLAGEHPAVYEPYGASGPSIDMLGSIDLLNRYCAKFPNDGLNYPIPRLCILEEWTERCVEFISQLFLPRNSPVYWPIKGTARIEKQHFNSTLARGRARAQSRMAAALNACAELHKRGELDGSLEPVGRQSSFEFLAEDGVADGEVADGGIGPEGSVKRKRAYKRKVPSVLEHSLPVPAEECHVFSVSMTLVTPGTHARALRSQVGPDPYSVRHGWGFLCRKPLPRLPDFMIHDRAGEMRVRIAASHRPVLLSCEQISLLKNFHGYVFKDILKFGNAPGVESGLTFDAEAAVHGCLVVLLRTTEQGNASCGDTIAWDFIHELEKSVEDFDDPKDPAVVQQKDFEIFRDKVLMSTHTQKKLAYYTVDVCYDCSPMDPFPSPEVAATFKEYYDQRYGMDICPNQPLLDVDHVSGRLNFLAPRHRNTKGREMSQPDTQSKRVHRAKVYLVPELCSIHPIPAHLWRRLVNLPTILYRLESLLLADELRRSIAREAAVGSVDWPCDVPLPPVTAGELVGEDFPPKTLVDNSGITTKPGEDHGHGTPTERATEWEPLMESPPVAARAADVAACDQTRDISGSETRGTGGSQTRDIRRSETRDTSDSQGRDSGDCQTRDSSGTPITAGSKKMEPWSQPTASGGFGRPEEAILQGRGRWRANLGADDTAGPGDAGEGRSMKDHARSEGERSCLPSELAVETGRLARESLGEKMSRLTVEPAQHKAGDTGESRDAPQDPTENRVDRELRPSPAQEPSVARGESSPPVEASLSVFASSGPPCTLLLRALTCSSATDLFSLERLEMYGDAFIKFAVSSELFHRFPHDNEGRLSFVRGLRVSNRQLFYVSRKRAIPGYMRTRHFDPAAGWIPPAFRVDVAESQTLPLAALAPASSGDEEEDDEAVLLAEPGGEVTGVAAPSSCLLNPYLHHVVSDKAVADGAEALVGAYLLCCGVEGGFRLLSWLGFQFSFREETRPHVAVTTDAVATGDREEVAPGELKSKLGAFDSDCHSLHDPSSYQRNREPAPWALPEEAATPSEKISRPLHGEYAARERVDLAGIQSSEVESRAGENSTKLEQKFHEIEHSLPVVHSQGEPFQEIEDSAPCPKFREADSQRYVDREDADSLRHEFQEVEDTLHYMFSDKSLLLQAFTHVSYPRGYNSVKSSYEQLEFLGDALMDFLLTRHLYFSHRDKEPGFLTDLRSALVNNYTFASLAVRCGFHRHLRAMSPPLFKIVHEFVVKQEEAERLKKPFNPDQVFSAVFTLPGVHGGEPVDVEVPKVLGDVLEAVAGAVYVDSGNDLETVWRVFFPLLKPSIDFYSVFLPISPVRRLLEMKGNAAHFAPPERTIRGQIRCTLVVKGLGTFVGLGRSYRIAKSAAAQRALNRLQAQVDGQ